MGQRKPPVRITLDTPLFNEMVSLLNENSKLKIDDNNFSLLAEKLKSKLLTYSLPIINEDGETFVEVGFFPYEASAMIWQLLIRKDRKINIQDFYTVLLQNRDS